MRDQYRDGARHGWLELLSRVAIDDEILATALIKVLAHRGFALAATLHARRYQPLEVYPYATLRLLDLPAQGKRTALGWWRIHAALQLLIPGLDHPDASEHGLEAMVCALTAQLWQQGRTIAVGDPLEGQMIIPDPAISPYAAVRATQSAPVAPPLRRVAESPHPYTIE